MKSIEIPQWPHAYGGPSGTGKIRTEPEDFIVNEVLSFEPSGEGEHVFLLIEKKGENTEFVARQLARFAGVRQRDIGYAGLKDRHAVTTQWFSVWLPGKEAPQWSDFESETITVHRSIRHARKLKRGILSGNRFELLIRDWQGDEKRLEDQLSRIKTCGVPNYFGEQRFGNLGQNVNKALSLFEGAKVKREQRGIYLSAARSFLFNHILAERIRLDNWNQPIDGDVFIVEGSRGFFKVDQIDPTISKRIDACEIHPSAVLCGQGASEATGEAWAIESAVIERFDFMVRGLFDCGLESARRALRMSLTDLEWRFISRGRLQLKFTLPAGSYATALLREIIES